MSSRKHRPVLYEVVRRSRLNAAHDARRAVLTSAPPSPARPLLIDEPPLEGQEVEPAALDDIAPVPSPRYADPAASGTTASPSWTAWLAEGRMHFSIGWIGAAVASVALVLVLFVTFQAGMRFATRTPDAPRANPAKPDTTAAPSRAADRNAPAQTTPDISVLTPPRAAAATPATPHDTPAVTNVAAAPPPTAQPEASAPPPAQPDPIPSAEPPTSDEFAFEANAYYLVIQHFPRDQGDAARQAQEFLRANAVDCVLRVASKDIRLIATRAFRLSGGDSAARGRERTALDGLKRRVKELGKEYTSTRPKGYAFDQCYELKQ